ncbi:MAG: ATP-dependent DNA helicase RecG [Armatimonadota bacterium]|jgi:ATP-dependent DNA helicase RecG
MDNAARTVIRRTLRALRLERRRGCDDSVPGGVEELIRHIVGQLASVDLPAPARESLRRLERDARGYHDLAPDRREPLITRAERLLEAIAPDDPAPPPPEEAAADEGNAQEEAPPAPLRWRDSVTELRGVGPTRAEALARMNIECAGDLLLHCPARYEDRRQVLTMREVTHGQTAVVRVTISGRGRRTNPRRGATAIIPAESGGTEGSLLFFGRPYLIDSLAEGDELLVIGTVKLEDGQPAIAVSEFETPGGDPGDAARIVPVYPTADGVSQNMLRAWTEQAIERCVIPDDPLPERLLAKRKLMPLSEALREMHRPSDLPATRASRHRLAYQELLGLQLALALRRRRAKAPEEGSALEVARAREQFVNALPFEPTAAQERVMDEIAADLSTHAPAHRLIHGDVGSGKTAVAALALAVAARAGKQAALMAPTEVLAEQHHESLRELLGPLGIEPVLLTGGLPGRQRRAALEALAEGRVACAVGTHALFSDGVEFARLAVVVIDEQHRFGVRQRARLSGKGERPNVFVMSATPIPRTLALAVHGDFDISVIDELPPGRKDPVTELLPAGERARAWELLRERVAKGRQAYVVCPAIDPSEEMAAATETFKALSAGPLSDLRLGLAHGRMTTEERHEAMRAFRDGETAVLVATSLIEVGVNVPNASTIVIENAERFGLAQLHQLRGRVARAGWQPHCLLLTGSGNSETLARLGVLTRTTDGFEIAEEDLRRRGPGELDGVRQSGLPDFRIASIIADTGALVDAREDAFAIIERDPKLESAEHLPLRGLVRRAWSGGMWTL